MQESNKDEQARLRGSILKKLPPVVNHHLESDEEAVVAVNYHLESGEEAPTVAYPLESDEEIAKPPSKKRPRSSEKTSLARSVSWPSFFGPGVVTEHTPTLSLSPVSCKFQKNSP
jgi:hypothetical protein